MSSQMPTVSILDRKLVPFHICGDTTERQRACVTDMLQQAFRESVAESLLQLDQRQADLAITNGNQLQSDVKAAVKDVIQRATTSALYKKEESLSSRAYPTAYKIRPIEAQVTALRKLFPALKKCDEKLARRPLPEDVEGWFAIPRWQAVAPTYIDALKLALEKLATVRRLSNRINEQCDRLSSKHLRQCARTEVAEAKLLEQQTGNDIYVVGAQFGHLHRGLSARRVRAIMAGNEFGLGTFAVACLLLTHPERLANINTLSIDCSGDEYLGIDGVNFDRVTLFDIDIGGIELSIFYHDRSTEGWGTPTAFLFR